MNTRTLKAEECGLRLQEEFGASLGEGAGVGIT